MTTEPSLWRKLKDDKSLLERFQVLDDDGFFGIPDPEQDWEVISVTDLPWADDADLSWTVLDTPPFYAKLLEAAGVARGQKVQKRLLMVSLSDDELFLVVPADWALDAATMAKHADKAKL